MATRGGQRLSHQAEMGSRGPGFWELGIMGRMMGKTGPWGEKETPGASIVL